MVRIDCSSRLVRHLHWVRDNGTTPGRVPNESTLSGAPGLLFNAKSVVERLAGKEVVRRRAN